MRILLADEEPRVRSAIRLFLEQRCEADVVLEVSNIQELMECIENYKPDVLMIDWHLTGQVPQKVFTVLRSLCPNVVTIMLDSEPETQQIALAAGADYFVGKNEPPESLLFAIKNSRCPEGKNSKRVLTDL